MTAATRDAVVANVRTLDELYLRDPRKARLVVLETVLMLHEMNQTNIARNTKLAALEATITGLEERPLMKDAGVWRHGSTYSPGDVTTFKGSAWVCTKAHTADGPVADHANWRLLMKGSR